MTTLKEQAVALRDYFANPDHWTFNALAKDEEGNEVLPNSPRAACHCLIGGVAKVCNVNVEYMESVYDAAAHTPLGRLLANVIAGHDVTDPGDACEIIWAFNDKDVTDHARIVQVLEDVVKRA
jgi:hypothetical protein